jgi:hypothetical protein
VVSWPKVTVLPESFRVVAELALATVSLTPGEVAAVRLVSPE